MKVQLYGTVMETSQEDTLKIFIQLIIVEGGIRRIQRPSHVASCNMPHYHKRCEKLCHHDHQLTRSLEYYNATMSYLLRDVDTAPRRQTYDQMKPRTMQRFVHLR